MKGTFQSSRRDFLKTGAVLGGGFVVGFYLPFVEKFAAAEGPQPTGKTFAPNAFLRIGSDDRITIIVGRSEMGQGVFTSLPMLVAEELEADWRKIRVESAPADPAYNHTFFGLQMTGGSTSVWSSYEQMRKAGATAKMMLIRAAAEQWKVAPESCRAEQGFVHHKASKRRLSFGQLADRAAKVPPPTEVKLKDAKDFKLIGKPTKRLDSLEKVTGRAQFGMDVRLPGMLTAIIARPPVFGAKLKSFDDTKAKAVPGVKEVVAVDAGVAVVATDFWAAKAGRDALSLDWYLGLNAGLSTDGLREQFNGLAKQPGTVANKQGNAPEALAAAAKQIAATYELPFLAHAIMEPLNCTVHLKPDSCEIWTGTQFQSLDRVAAAKTAALKIRQVSVHTPFLGGGFGRRGNPASDFVVEAVQVAKALKAPVKVVWTREDDIQGGYYRPMVHSTLAAGLDSQGQPVAWTNRIVGPSIMLGTPFEGEIAKTGIDPTSVEGAADLPYAVPNLLVEVHYPRPGIPVLWWRSVGHSVNAFVTESFIDELAFAAGKEPFEFRRLLLANHPRHRGVLELAAEKAGWGKALPPGIGRGIAVHASFKSYVAQVAEVSVEKNGKVKVHRVVCAVDCGAFVNPATIEAQMEGGISFGLGAALYSAITFKDGKVEQSNFHDYQVSRITDMPKVEVHIVQSREAPGGIGEPGVPPIAPAVANAIFALTGKRLRRLPIDPGGLQA